MKKYLKSLGISHIKLMNGFHNQVFQGVYLNQSIIIRISQRRSYEETYSEICLLVDLSKVIPVNTPVKVDGQYLTKKSNHILSFYTYVEAKNWYEIKLTADIHFRAGISLGKLHQYTMGRDSFKRKSFEYHPDIDLVKKTPIKIQNALNDTLKTIKQIPKAKKYYGLIHGDYLFSNIMYQNQALILIDFDDIEYHYYLYDIAVYLFYLLLGGNPSKIDIEPNIDVFKSFIKGYRSVNKETVLPFEHIQCFFRLRQLKLYATIYQMPKTTLGPWQKAYLSLTEEQIENDKDFIMIDYQNLFIENI